MPALCIVLAVMHTVSLRLSTPAPAIKPPKDSCLHAVVHAAAAAAILHMSAKPARGAALRCCVMWEPLGRAEAGLDLQAVLHLCCHTLLCWTFTLRCTHHLLLSLLLSDGTLELPQQHLQQPSRQPAA